MTIGRTETGKKNGPPKNNQEKDSPLAPQGLTCCLPAPKEGSVSPVNPECQDSKNFSFVQLQEDWLASCSVSGESLRVINKDLEVLPL